MNFNFMKEHGRFRGIYIITNNITGEQYVGQAVVSFKKRYFTHRYTCFCSKTSKGHRKSKFYNNLRKYGWDNFSFDILSFCDSQNEMDKLERYYISRLDTMENGLNSTIGGHSGKICSPETKRRMSEAKKNISEETRKKLSESLMGHKHSDETKLKISKSHTGKKCPWKINSFTQEQIQKSIEKRSVPIFMFNDKEVLEYFPSILAASRWLIANNMIKPRFSNGSTNPEVSIRTCATGKHKSPYSYGYKWMFGLKVEFHNNK